QTKNANTAYGVFRICTLAPDAVDDPAQFTPLARLVAQSKNDAKTYRHKAAVAYYRAGQFELAIKLAEESRDIDPNWEGIALNWLVLAMAHHQLGKDDQARENLEKASRWIKEKTTEEPNDSLGPIGKISTTAWLNCRVLHREAEALIRSQKSGNNSTD